MAKIVIEWNERPKLDFQLDLHIVVTVKKQDQTLCRASNAFFTGLDHILLRNSDEYDYVIFFVCV